MVDLAKAFVVKCRSIFPTEHIDNAMPAHRTIRCVVALFSALSLAGQTAPAAAAADVVVFAAASLKDALDDVSTRYLNATGRSVTVSYGASSTLAQQIEQGAPADIFFSADVDWMNELAAKQLIQSATQMSLLGNQIVLVAPKSASTGIIMLAKGIDLAALLGKDGRLAMANVDSVPAGKYGKAALEGLGLWRGVANRVVQADNVRAALSFVSRGEAPLGIVYATDANAEPGVKVIGTFPPESHPPIVYPLALTTDSKNPDARAFYDFLRSDAARPAYLKQGFAVLAAPR
jgi:molybdate transport system substrate-binding protein